MPEDARVDTVRSMLLAPSSPPDTTNDQMISTNNRSDSRKKCRRDDSSHARSTTKYASGGQNICMAAFAEITQVSLNTLSQHAHDVSTAMGFAKYTTKHLEARLGKLGASRGAVIAFLKRYAAGHALLCRTGRGSNDTGQVAFLPSDCTKSKVYDDYKLEWKYIIQAAHEEASSQGILSICLHLEL